MGAAPAREDEQAEDGGDNGAKGETARKDVKRSSYDSCERVDAQEGEAGQEVVPRWWSVLEKPAVWSVTRFFGLATVDAQSPCNGISIALTETKHQSLTVCRHGTAHAHTQTEQGEAERPEGRGERGGETADGGEEEGGVEG